ncbi:MAG: hypothetical protein ACR2PS_18960 [Pseudomonadales bacterium]
MNDSGNRSVSQMRKRLFPRDKRVEVIRPDGSTYKTWASDQLRRVHGWTAVEIQISQMPRPTVSFDMDEIQAEIDAL